jgi:hypothetical protein
VQQFDYINLGDGLPLAPIIDVKITPPNWMDNSRQYQIISFLDTGSDCTLISLEIISILQLSIIDTSVQVNGIGGSQLNGYPCYINIWLGEKCVQAVKVYGCESERIEGRVLIGRDILNQCCIEFDGINCQLIIKN